MFFFYYDYLWLMIIPLLLGLWAQARVNSAFSKYSRIQGYRGYTGADVARMILDEHGLRHIPIERVRGNLTDHYDPRAGVVRLSEGVYGSTSIAAVGIAAHECGHALQHAEGYLPMRIRSAIIPVTNFGSRLAIPLILAGFLFGYYPLVMVGLVGYALIALFQLVTLPVEYNASSRAMSVIENANILQEEEQKGAKKVLHAAALTYVAALITSLAQLLRLFLIFGGGRRRR